MRSLRFAWHPGYAALALAVFLIEVGIALWVRDAFIRPYGGDMLAVVLVYLALRAVTNLRAVPAAVIAWGVGILVELGQAVQIVVRLGLSDNDVARIVLGTGFSWLDMFCYAAGALLVLLMERWRGQRLQYPANPARRAPSE